MTEKARGFSEVRLCGGPGGLVAIVSDDDYPRVAGIRWHAHRGWAGIWYARGRPDGRRKVLMHRFLTGVGPSDIVDHRNRNGLDNTRDNMRVCTQGQNLANKIANHGKVLPKGVTFDKSRGKFRAEICCGGRRHSSPRFITVVEAADWYRGKAVELHGEFARS